MSVTQSPPPESGTVLDTSKMSAGQRAAVEMTEAARDDRARNTGFAASLFMGQPNLASLLPFPKQSAEDHDQGDAFLARLQRFLLEHVDPDAIDREGEIPQEVLDGLAKLGAFGIKIPIKYGGLGLSQTNYSRAAMLLGSYCGNLTALLSAHQSIGVPQPLLMFGTEAQKSTYLTRCAKGEISAFALTEPDVGSDPARMKTSAVLEADGQHYVINGEKLWCTNGTKAGVLVVMAKTPLPGHPNATTAFIVETSMPGVEVVRRSHFMGLRALYNGVIRFKNVRVPVSNIIGGEGRGLKVALFTLNTGRITLPAACAGLAKRCLEISTDWAKSREQWGQAIGKHAAIADKLARMAAQSFALEAMVYFVSSLVDKDKNADVRLEAAMAKLWGTERAWEMVDQTMQIRGGRGYETAESLVARGEKGVPVERFMRDARINTIFEGSSEIMRLFIAREMLDPHLKIGASAFNSKLSLGARFKSFLNAARFYTKWYPARWIPTGPRTETKLHPILATQMRRVNRLSRRMARGIFHAMMRFGPKLEREQLVLGRLVDIGTEIFALAAATAYASTKIQEHPGAEAEQTLHLVRYFGNLVEDKVAILSRDPFSKTDRQGYAVAKALLS